MALLKAASQSETLWNYDPNLAVDGDSNTCSFTPQSDVQRWWQVSEFILTATISHGNPRISNLHLILLTLTYNLLHSKLIYSDHNLLFSSQSSTENHWFFFQCFALSLKAHLYVGICIRKPLRMSKHFIEKWLESAFRCRSQGYRSTS